MVPIKLIVSLVRVSLVRVYRSKILVVVVVLLLLVVLLAMNFS